MAIRRGDTAKQYIVDTIIKAFGDDYLGTQDKKLFIKANDGNEFVQIAISLTMPKTPIAATETNCAFEQDHPSVAAPPSMELSEDDKAAVTRLMEQLGITD